MPEIFNMRERERERERGRETQGGQALKVLSPLVETSDLQIAISTSNKSRRGLELNGQNAVHSVINLWLLLI